MAIVFDIETIGRPFEELPTSVQEKLLRGTETEDERETRRRQTALMPYTGEIVCVALHNTESGGGQVMFRAGTQAPPRVEGVEFLPFEEEAGVLARFWESATRIRESRKPENRTLVSFNGRGFDIPYLEIRSAIRGVRVTWNLLGGSRYNTDAHVDLMEQLTFYGATFPRPSLDMVCHAFGVTSPKSEEAHGYKVQEMWEQGLGADIAEYCYRDVVATGAVYRKWREFMQA